METTASDRRRRTMRQLLFVIAGSHTGAFLGSALPHFGLPGDVFGAAVVGFLLALPLVVDAHWERVDPYFQKVMQ
jgi:predicted membrane protein